MAVKQQLIAITLLVGVLAGAFSGPAVAQNCGCDAGVCCSQYGYCRTGSLYCGAACQAGPCDSGGGGASVSVSEIVTTDFFNGIHDKASETSCVGRSFYKRSAFLDAVDFYPNFGQVAVSADDSKREIAAIFAHVTALTDHFCHIEQLNDSSEICCDESYTDYPCVAGKNYCGRGPIQIARNYYYGPVGESIGFDGLNNPEIVGNDSVVSFKTALWYWMTYVHPVVGQGFGATINAINPPDCDEENKEVAKERFSFYQEYCDQFGVLTTFHHHYKVHIF